MSSEGSHRSQAPRPLLVDALTSPQKLLYLGGYSRSGSTLLSRVLAEAPGSVCVGESRYLWSRGLRENVRCGCGVAFRDCPFWSAVGQEAFGGWENVDAQELSEIDRRLNMLVALPLYLAPRMPARMAEAVERYTAVLASLYRAVACVSGARTIVETSKAPTFACLLARVADSDLRVVHLVRDSRAVAYSWTRRRALSSPIDGQAFMPEFRPSDTALRWLAWNCGFHAIAATSTPCLKLGYESFVADPAAALRRLSSFTQESLLLDASRMTDGKVQLDEHHIFSGNPMRTSKGWLAIRLDSEWQRGLSVAQLAKITAITWPLLRRYGYPLLVARAREDAHEPRGEH